MIWRPRPCVMLPCCGGGACVSLWLWELYRRGFIPPEGSTKLGRSQSRGLTKSRTWSSRLGFGHGANNPTLEKKHSVTETTTTKTHTYPGPEADLSQAIGEMTIPNESLQEEVSDMMASLLKPKVKFRIGAWNVCTVHETSKSVNQSIKVWNKMRRYHLDILWVNECNWTGPLRQIMSDGSTILYSGHKRTCTNGVALVIAKEKVNTLKDWEPISDWMIRARFNSKYCKFNIIQCYAATNEADDEVKAEWYEHVSQVISKVPHHNMLLITGDLNTKVGEDNTNYERAMGKHGFGVMNNNSECLADFCLNNNCIIVGSIFPYRTIHKLTWRSPDGRSFNQIISLSMGNGGGHLHMLELSVGLTFSVTII